MIVDPDVPPLFVTSHSWSVLFVSIPVSELRVMKEIDKEGLVAANLARGYKTFFMLNLTEHKSLTAHKN